MMTKFLVDYINISCKYMGFQQFLFSLLLIEDLFKKFILIDNKCYNIH